jgi:serine/threonine protein phosphatase PrpC
VSEATVRALEAELKNNNEYSIDYIYRLLQRKYEQINDHIYSYSRSSGKVMVTTLSMINIVGYRMIISNVGDTKIFRIRDKKLTLLSKVYTVAWSQFELGIINEKQLNEQ